MVSNGLALAVAFLCTVAVVAAQSSPYAQPSPHRLNSTRTEELSDELDNILTSTIDRGELFEGDLKLSSDTVRKFYDLNSLPSIKSESCSSSPPADKSLQLGEHLTMWPEGVIHYSLDPSVLVPLARTVREAMDKWEEATCLHFVSKDPEITDDSPTNYVNFLSVSGGGCYSDSVGMKGGQQVVNLGNSGCQTRGEIMHLIGHVVGLWHEQSRPDRDNYLLVIPGNIKEGRRQDFMKLKGNGKEYRASDLFYDYESIMHYDLSVSSKCETRSNMCLTLVITNLTEYMEQSYPTVGQRDIVGEGDLRKVSLLYNGTEDSDCPPASKKGRLSVYVDKAYSIPFTGDTPDAYVKISAKAISPNGNTIETIRSTTHVRHNLQNPVWDELLDMGGREWMPFFRIEVWDSDAGADDLISIPEEVMIDRIHMERTHCINPSCQGYIRYTYSFTHNGDECLPNPCQNGGNCIDGISSYTCSCPPAWTGTNCHIRLTCYNKPCQNGGTCYEQTNHHIGTSTYTCSCPSDWIGKNCQSRLACFSQPCENGGTCTNDIIDSNAGTSTYTCSCKQSWFGNNCQFRLPCSNRPCENGGTCTNEIIDSNAGTSTYTCSCKQSWFGNNCQFRRPCSLKPCKNGGKCTDHITDYDAGIATYSCDCPSDWRGTTCDTRYAKLRVYVDYGSEFDPYVDPYVRIIAYDYGSYTRTKYSRTEWNDQTPKWEEWLDFGTNDWYKIHVQVLENDGDGSYKPLSSTRTYHLYPGSSNTYTLYCYKGYIKFRYDF